MALRFIQIPDILAQDPLFLAYPQLNRIVPLPLETPTFERIVSFTDLVIARSINTPGMKQEAEALRAVASFHYARTVHVGPDLGEDNRVMGGGNAELVEAINAINHTLALLAQGQADLQQTVADVSNRMDRGFEQIDARFDVLEARMARSDVVARNRVLSATAQPLLAVPTVGGRVLPRGVRPRLTTLHGVQALSERQLNQTLRAYGLPQDGSLTERQSVLWRTLGGGLGG